jgi:hypothetical protein
MILKKPSRFLAAALLVACGLTTVQNFANAADLQGQTPPAAVQDNSVLNSSDFSGKRSFATKSMDGQSVRFLIEGRDIVYEGLPDVPRATPVVLDMKDAGCVVNVEDKGWEKAGGDLSFHGAKGDLLLVNGELARISNTNHEMGHCIDFAVMPKVIASLAGTGASVPSVLNIALTQALDGNGIIDVDAVANKGADYILDNRLASYEASVYTSSIQETYADLHAIFQTAALTGTYDSFTNVVNSYRNAIKWDLNHADDIVLFRILSQETESGVKATDLMGKSHEEVTAYVNAVFKKHFYDGDKLSINSDGFKTIVQEIHLRSKLTPNLATEYKDMIDRFDAKLLDKSVHGTAVQFMALSQKAIDHQRSLLNSGQVDTSHMPQAGDVVAKQMGNHHASLKILGVSDAELQTALGSPVMATIFRKQDPSMTAAADKIYEGARGSSIMRRAIQAGGDYNLNAENSLLRANFKDALLKQDLLKGAAADMSANGPS